MLVHGKPTLAYSKAIQKGNSSTTLCKSDNPPQSERYSSACLFCMADGMERGRYTGRRENIENEASEVELGASSKVNGCQHRLNQCSNGKFMVMLKLGGVPERNWFFTVTLTLNQL